MNKIANKYKVLTNRAKQGYAVLELLFYIALFVILSLVVIDSMITMAKSFRETSIQSELEQTGNIMERITREIRKANDISTAGSGLLVVNSKDDAGLDKTVQFLLTGGNLQLWENGVLTGNLNTPNITVTSLTFTQINTTKSKAVKIALTVKSNNDASSRSVDFYDTVVLRNSY